MPPKFGHQRGGYADGNDNNQGHRGGHSSSRGRGDRGGRSNYNGPGGGSEASNNGNPRGGPTGSGRGGHRGHALGSDNWRSSAGPNTQGNQGGRTNQDFYWNRNDSRPYRAEREYPCRAGQRVPRLDLLTQPDEPVAVDVEFQFFHWYESNSGTPKIGRIAVVNTHGDVIYDTYVQYERKEGLDVRPAPKKAGKFNVTKRDLCISTGAQKIDVVEKDLRDIFTGRPIIGFGMGNDRIAIGSELLSYGSSVRDTQGLYPLVNGNVPGLESLVGTHLSRNHFNLHDPRDDARATMLLYMRIIPYDNRSSFPTAPVANRQQVAPAATHNPVATQNADTADSNASPADQVESSGSNSAPQADDDWAEASGPNTVQQADNDTGSNIYAYNDQPEHWAQANGNVDPSAGWD